VVDLKHSAEESMSLTTPVLAEISDKMLSWPALLAWSSVLSAAAWFLSRKKKWLVLVPLPLSLVFAAGSIEEMRDPFFAPAVIQELGYSYWIVSFTPLVAIIAAACIQRKADPVGTDNVRAAPGRV
jgi:hypothetical protein